MKLSVDRHNLQSWEDAINHGGGDARTEAPAGDGQGFDDDIRVSREYLRPPQRKRVNYPGMSRIVSVNEGEYSARVHENGHQRSPPRTAS
jgi:hypothetical protein